MSVYYVVLDLISASSGHAASERASDRCTLPLAVGNQDSSSGLALITESARRDTFLLLGVVTGQTGSVQIPPESEYYGTVPNKGPSALSSRSVISR